SEAVAERLAQGHWNGAAFLTASAFSAGPPADAPFSMQAWLSDMSGRTRHLLQEIDRADPGVMIAAAGESLPAAPIIRETPLPHPRWGVESRPGAGAHPCAAPPVGPYGRGRRLGRLCCGHAPRPACVTAVVALSASGDRCRHLLCPRQPRNSFDHRRRGGDP